MYEKVKTPRAHPLFKEVQKFRQPLLFLLIFSLSSLIIIIFGYGMVKQLIYHEPWGDKPMSDTGLLIFGSFFIILSILMFLAFIYSRLITEVHDDGLYVRFYPFHLKYIRFPFESIESCEATIYHPIKDYGGWGIRYGRRGKAYNVHGNKGVLIKFKDGNQLLIGSQKPQELAQIILSYLR